MTFFSKNNFYKISFFSYLLIITFLFLVPLDSDLVTNFIEKEKQPSNRSSFLIHFINFFILYLIINLSFKNTIKNIFFCLFYSILIEYFQLFTLRGFQLLDIFYNILGLSFSILILNLFSKIDKLN